MNWRLRLDVVKHDAVLILVFDLRRNLSINDLLENGFAHGMLY
jgi:hypothetical protein